ncbi:helix-turn-helix domain-containing protein [Streptomyces sp. URMC 123]|uniref:helix-turn-helix domain-containing protein n=1 Tax=Streptomyces sp. URMC 123 TaxID=3423403 RepID=UPI003F1C5F94
MSQPLPSSEPYRPPFDARAARRLREALHMAHSQVAYGIWAAYGRPVHPSVVAAWESGELSPTEEELTALAGALWCSPADLMGAPGTLREHRMTRRLSPVDLALRVGMEPEAYERLERTGQWRGTDRQAEALAEVLELSLPDLVRVTGRAEQLTELLHSAVTTRWQAYVKPVDKLLPLPRGRVEAALRALHAEYQERASTALAWAPAGERRETGQDFLDSLLDHFWERVGH